MALPPSHAKIKNKMDLSKLFYSKKMWKRNVLVNKIMGLI
jgi:hypothetical protein